MLPAWCGGAFIGRTSNLCRVLQRFGVTGLGEILKERHRDLKSGKRGESNSVTRTHTPFLHIPMLSKQTDGNEEQAHGKHLAESSQTIALISPR